MHYGNPDDFAYDVVSGISVGSLNALVMMGYPVGEELAMSESMSALWKNLKTSDIWKDWYMTPIDGLFTKAGLMDNSPMLDFVHTLVNKGGQTGGEFDRKITIGAVDFNDGTFHRFNQTNTSYEDMAKAACSSAAVPGLFPPYNWEGKGLFVDGGLASNLNIEDAILQCKELVEDESKISVDVLICQESQEVDEWDAVGKTATNYFRAGTYWDKNQS